MAKTAVGRSHAAHAIPLAQASEAFRPRCQAQNLSAGTLIWYGENIKRWYRYLDAQGVTLAKQVTPTLIRSSLEDMRERMIPENPFQFVEKPRMEKKLILGRPTLEMTRRYVIATLERCASERSNGDHQQSMRLISISILFKATGAPMIT